MNVIAWITVGLLTIVAVLPIGAVRDIRKTRRYNKQTRLANKETLRLIAEMRDRFEGR